MEGETQPEEQEKYPLPPRNLAQRGWNEAKTIIIGSLVFVAAFQWRDLIQHLLKKVEKRIGSNFPKTLVMLVIAISVTLMCVILVCFSKEAVTSTRLARIGTQQLKNQLERFQTYN